MSLKERELPSRFVTMLAAQIGTALVLTLAHTPLRVGQLLHWRAEASSSDRNVRIVKAIPAVIALGILTITTGGFGLIAGFGAVTAGGVLTGLGIGGLVAGVGYGPSLAWAKMTRGQIKRGEQPGLASLQEVHVRSIETARTLAAMIGLMSAEAQQRAPVSLLPGVRRVFLQRQQMEADGEDPDEGIPISPVGRAFREEVIGSETLSPARKVSKAESQQLKTAVGATTQKLVSTAGSMDFQEVARIKSELMTPGLNPAMEDRARIIEQLTGIDPRSVFRESDPAKPEPSDAVKLTYAALSGLSFEDGRESSVDNDERIEISAELAAAATALVGTQGGKRFGTPGRDAAVAMYSEDVAAFVNAGAGSAAKAYTNMNMGTGTVLTP